MCGLVALLGVKQSDKSCCRAKLLYAVLPFKVNLARPQSSAAEADGAAVPPSAAASSSSRPLQVSIAGCPLPETLNVPPAANRQVFLSGQSILACSDHRNKGDGWACPGALLCLSLIKALLQI